MKFNIIVDAIVKSYQEDMAKADKAIGIIKNDPWFTDAGKQEHITQIIAEKQTIADEANEALQHEINEFIKEHKLGEPAKNPDYELKVANALKMIEMLGGNLTDETALQLLDFPMDLKQLGIFRTVLETKCSGHMFTKTFQKLDAAAEQSSYFDRLRESAEGLFNHKNPLSPSEIRVANIQYYADAIAGSESD
jgi:hypothetical protein